MATLDEILGRGKSQQNSGDNSGNSPKGSAAWTEQNSGDNAPSSTSAASENKTASTTADPEPQQNSIGGYEGLINYLNPFRPPTQEEVEKERKRQRTSAIIAALGDGMTAMTNLFFTTRGAPNMYTGENTLSAATQARYDKLKNEWRDNATTYLNGYLKIKQAEEATKNTERAWQRQLGLDKQAKENYDAEWAYKKQQDEANATRYQNEQDYRKKKDEKEYQKWKTVFDAEQKQQEIVNELNRTRIDNNYKASIAKAKAAAAKGVRGKQLGFADGQGNHVSIYENVWKQSKQYVLEILLKDEQFAKNPIVPLIELGQASNNAIDNFINQNWNKSEKAKDLMLTLSGIDPATMVSELSEDDNDDYSQYEVSEDDDYSQYEVK